MPGIEDVPLLAAAGRVLAEDLTADRDYPPFPRSARDGFAVRASDLPGRLEVIGEVRAGEQFAREVGAGQAVEIMTGAPVPAGADAVIMVEHTRRDDGLVVAEDSARSGDNFNPRGIEARAGQTLVRRGERLSFRQIAMLATVGYSRVHVYEKPRVGIIPTGDEIVGIEETPRECQIRNSNAYSLASQVSRTGGTPVLFPVARDVYDSTRDLVERGLQTDLLLLSGGVSAGKYDIVEKVLADLGAEFFFDRVRIQPGQPLVFGRAQGRFFFGLPGNPASTMVTFEVLARAALELLAGREEAPLAIAYAHLTCDFRHKMGLTRFLPARLSAEGGEVTPEPWHGSGDVPALARANCFLVAEEDRESWSAGDWIRVLLT